MQREGESLEALLPEIMGASNESLEEGEDDAAVMARQFMGALAPIAQRAMVHSPPKERSQIMAWLSRPEESACKSVIRTIPAVFAASVS